MTTTQRQIQQEIKTLPDSARQEALDFILFLKMKFQTQIEQEYREKEARGIVRKRAPKKSSSKKEVLNAASEKLLRQSEMELANGEAYTFNNADEAIAFIKNIANVSL